MGRFRVNKKFIFIIGVVLVIAFVIKKGPEELSEEREPARPSEAFVLPQISEDTEQTTEVGEEQKILSFDMTGYTDDGRKKWDIQGTSADIISGIVILSNIEANTYNEDRQVLLKAQKGTYDKKKNSILLEKDVTVTTSDGINLTAEWLKWESETNMINTDSFVEVEKGNLYASGYGASTSTEDQEVQLNKDVVVKQGEVTIRCSGPLTIDYANNKASFYGGVKVTEPRGQLLADRLDVFFDPESRDMEKVVAERNVELMHGQNIAKGQRVVYTQASGEAHLTGNPEILIYSEKDFKNAFTGD